MHSLPIPEPDLWAANEVRRRQNRLLKPAGSLGRLEELSARYASITGDWRRLYRAPVCLIFAGDHGLARHLNPAQPIETTRLLVTSLLEGGAAAGVLARQMGAALWVVDAGAFEELPAHDRLIAGKLGTGTSDFLNGPAMRVEEAGAALDLGRRAAQSVFARGGDLLVVGAMGLGTELSAATILAALTGCPVRDALGAGQTSETEELIAEALHLHDPADVETLHTVGGFEIGALAGAIIAAAHRRVPVLLDGPVSLAAALVAEAEAPGSAYTLLAYSAAGLVAEQATLERLGLVPSFELGISLGQGVGALVTLPLVEASLRLLQEMDTWAEAGLSSGESVGGGHGSR